MPAKSLYSALDEILAAKVVTLQTARPGDLVSDSVKRMYDEDVGALAVIDDGALVGIFTERDALYRVLQAKRDPAATTLFEVMTRDPEVVSPRLKVIDALRMVNEQRFRHLPLSEHGKLVGLLSSGDLTGWILRIHDAETAKLEGSFFGLVLKNKAVFALLATLIGLIALALLTT